MLEEKINRSYEITIVTVVYNALNEIKPTFENILPKLSSDVEYLIIDGGSTDGSVDFFKLYDTNPHLRYISEKDKGIYNAMNKAIGLARGRWIWFINAGDYVIKIPDLKKLHDASVACFAVETEEGIEYPKYDRSLRLRNTLPHQGILYKVKNFKGFDERFKIFADYAYNLRALNAHEKVQTLSDVVAFHSLTGLSNDKRYGKELKSVLREFNSMPYYFLSQINFKIRGLKKRFKRLRE